MATVCGSNVASDSLPKAELENQKKGGYVPADGVNRMSPEEMSLQRRRNLLSGDENVTFTKEGRRRPVSSDVEAALRELKDAALKQFAKKPENNQKNLQVIRCLRGNKPTVKVHARKDYKSPSDVFVQQVDAIKLLHLGTGERIDYRLTEANTDVSHFLKDGVMPPEATKAWPLDFASVESPESGKEYWWMLTFMRKTIEELYDEASDHEIVKYESDFDQVKAKMMVGQSKWMRVFDSVDESSLTLDEF